MTFDALSHVNIAVVSLFVCFPKMTFSMQLFHDVSAFKSYLHAMKSPLYWA